MESEGTPMLSGMQSYIEQLEKNGDITAAPKVPVNVRLDTLDGFKLHLQAECYNKKKSTFATEILKIAIEDAWKAGSLEEIETSEIAKRLRG